MKKKLTKAEKRMSKVLWRQNERFKETFSWFYSDGTIENFKFPAVEEGVFESLYESSDQYTDEDDKEGRESIENDILRIHQNVLEGKTGYLEVRFDKGMIYSGGEKYELANTIAMIRDGCYFLHVFFKAGDRHDVKIFMEEGTENAYLVLKWDGSEEVEIFLLYGFCLFSMWCEEGSVKDTGIMIDYDWTEKNKNFDIVDEVIFSPAKGLLVADWLQEKWKKTKEANEKRKESIAQQEKISEQKTT